MTADTAFTETVDVYGAADVAGSADRPLVTFAIYAFNEEPYIREAIESALAQTYQPLEILLSDDGSTDRTVQIMQEMAAQYRGPHRIVLRHGARNLGTAAHVERMFHIATGEIVVMAGGDDHSFAHRTERVVAFLRAHPTLRGCCSDLVGYSGRPILSTPPKTAQDLLARRNWIIGASAVFYRDLVTAWPPLGPDAHHEDDILCLRALLSGTGFGHIPEPLVRYREGVGESAEYMRGAAYDAIRKPPAREITYRLRLMDQWQSDLTHKGKGDLAVCFAPMKSYYTYLKAITTRRLTLTGIVKAVRELGLKCVIYEFARYRANAILAHYVRWRHRHPGRDGHGN